MPLTALTVKRASAREKSYKKSDGGGLFLLVKPGGSKLWRFKYQYSGKEKLISFGSYPDVSLSQAREARSEARRELLAGINPSEARKSRKASKESSETTLEMIGREWLKDRKFYLVIESLCVENDRCMLVLAPHEPVRGGQRIVAA